MEINKIGRRRRDRLRATWTQQIACIAVKKETDGRVQRSGELSQDMEKVDKELNETTLRRPRSACGVFEEEEEAEGQIFL